MNPEQQRIYDALLKELEPYGFYVTYQLIYGNDDRAARVTISGHGLGKEIIILPSGQIL